MPDVSTAVAAGLAAGLATGGATHGAVALVRHRKNSWFFGVWAAGILLRLAFVGLALWWLFRRPEWPLVPTTLALLAGQFVVQLIPIKIKKPSSKWT